MRVLFFAVAFLALSHTAWALTADDCDVELSLEGTCVCTGLPFPVSTKTCKCIDGYSLYQPGDSADEPGLCVEDPRFEPFKKDSRIGIIGAGPAGIHMASKLKQRGYKNIELLEKTQRIGGKSYTLIDEEGVPHEMGTCYLHSGYNTIRDLIEEYGCAEEVVPTGRAVFQPSTTGNPHIGMEIEEYVGEGFFNKAKLASSLLRYKFAHQAVMGEFNFNMPPRLNQESLTAINMTYGAWLDSHGIGELRNFLKLSETAQGYGVVDLIPAFYGLWWITPALTDGFLQQSIGIGNPSLSMLNNGYSSIWNTMYKKENLTVVFDVNIDSVVRDSPKANIIISGDIKGEAFEKQYDFLVLTTPYKLAHQFLKDTTPTEDLIFPALNSFTLTTTLYSSDPVLNYTDSSQRSIAYQSDDLDVGGDGKWNCDRYSAAAIRPEKAQWTKPQNRVAYQFYNKEQTKDENRLPPFKRDTAILNELEERLKDFGVKNVKIINQFPWPYFYHFDQAGINAGYPWTLLEHQGDKHTWYAGSSASFESVHDVTNYNMLLIDRYLPDEQQ